MLYVILYFVILFYVIFSPTEAKTVASSMIGKLLITKQTGPAGKICNSVMVTTRMFPRKEYYMSVMLETSFDVNYSSLKIVIEFVIQNKKYIYNLGSCNNCI